MLPSIACRIAAELKVRESQVAATIELLNDGATVPFIARYRKEVTGNLIDTQLRQLAERLTYLSELDERRNVILKSIAAQGKLTTELEASVLAANNKTSLEDLYLSYKPKRRTKAQIAREAGLAPLAQSLVTDPTQDPRRAAESYVDAAAAVTDASAALEGARAILMESFAEEAALLGRLREQLWAIAELQATVVNGKEEVGAKFSDYFAYCEPIRGIAAHRALALLRGRNEGILNLALIYQSDDIPATGRSEFEQCIALYFGIEDKQRPADQWLLDSVRLCWRTKIFLSLEVELLARLKAIADDEAINVFAANLHDLLLAAPAGRRVTMGLDPGVRTGVKVAVVDSIGKLVDSAVIYPHAPKHAWEQSLTALETLVVCHKVELIAIGNGTASRETDKLVQDLLKRCSNHRPNKVIVSEAGASVYSASELASQEFPQLDVSLRGAVSIARRLQDPLAELVKIDPKAIGVGQYQHDVDQRRLASTLTAVVEDCVNAVGVDVNTASAVLLAHISGLNSALATNIVAWREQYGAFRNRRALLEVPRVGKKTFEQAAGFLRISGGDNPLDASAVHPEAYSVVQTIAVRCARNVASLIGDTPFLKTLRAADYVSESVGLPTLMDILRELDKPGRDPRPEFKTAIFQEGVEELADLAPGMVLEGVVTNVTNFGAFVDIGVHQDGLVHISALSTRYVKDPRQVAKAGDIVTVKVLDIDMKRRRIALTMRLNEEPQVPSVSSTPRHLTIPREVAGASTTTMAAAFAKLKR